MSAGRQFNNKMKNSEFHSGDQRTRSFKDGSSYPRGYNQFDDHMDNRYNKSNGYNEDSYEQKRREAPRWENSSDGRNYNQDGGFRPGRERAQNYPKEDIGRCYNDSRTSKNFEQSHHQQNRSFKFGSGGGQAYEEFHSGDRRTRSFKDGSSYPRGYNQFDDHMDNRYNKSNGYNEDSYEQKRREAPRWENSSDGRNYNQDGGFRPGRERAQNYPKEDIGRCYNDSRTSKNFEQSHHQQNRSFKFGSDRGQAYEEGTYKHRNTNMKDRNSDRYSDENSDGYPERSHNDFAKKQQRYKNDDYQFSRANYHNQREKEQYERKVFQNDGGFGKSSRPENDYEETEIERAPKDWMPDEKPVDALFDEARRNAEELNINEDEKLEIKNSNITIEFASWENLGLSQRILKNVVKCGYTKPRPIQCAVIPQVMNGFDVIGQAETGGGKTAAFGLPIVHKILEIPETERLMAGKEKAPYCIVLAPVRELAHQIYNSFKTFCEGTEVLVQVSYGEMNRNQCLKQIQRGCHILVGTCGRIMDFVLREDISLKNLRFFVLDEADRLLKDVNQGSGDHLQSIMERDDFKNSPLRQTLLFSATFNSSVEHMAKQFMKPAPGYNDIVRIVLSQGRLNPRVRLHFIEVKDLKEKNDKLAELLLEKKPNGQPLKTLIFVETKKRTDFLAMKLLNLDFAAQSINGDRPQNLREEILNNFRNGEIDVLIGTDVCSRGLDINDLDRVINFDLPKGSIEAATDTFIHRVGRTGRLKNGNAYSFINPFDVGDSILIPAFKGLMKNDETLPAFIRSSPNPKRFETFQAKPSTFGGQNKTFGSTSFGLKKDELESDGELEKKSAKNDSEEEW